MTERIFLICGPPQQGKDTFGEMLADALGSEQAAPSDVIYEELCRRKEIDQQPGGWHPDPRVTRDEMIELGDNLVEHNVGYLIETLIDKGFRVITGVRRAGEARSVETACSIIWIERKDFPLIKDNTEFELKEMAHFTLRFEEGGFSSMKKAAEDIADDFRDESPPAG